MTQDEVLVELTLEEIDQVSGGFLAGVAAGVVASAAWDAIKGFGSWVNQQGPGGADDGTWERIGQSQMTA